MRACKESKEIGFDLIGDFPKDWKRSRLKYVSSYNDISLHDDTDKEFEFTYIEISDVDARGQIGSGTVTTFRDSPSRARRVLQKNDIIISTVRTYLRSIATITEDRDDLVGSTGFCVFKCKNELYYGYLSYLVHTEWFVAKAVSNSEGVSYSDYTNQVGTAG